MENFNNFLESLHYLNHPILSGIVAASILLLGIFVLFKNSKSPLFRAFFWMTLTFFIWFFGNTLSMLYFDNLKLSFFWFKFAYTAVPFMGISYYYFCLTHLNKRGKIIHPLFLISLLEVICLWIFSDLDKASVYVLPNVGIVWKTMTPFSYFLVFGMIKYAVLTTLTAMTFFKAYKKETDFLKKKQLKLLSIIFFVLIFGAMEWLVAFSIPLHIAWTLVPFFIGIIAYNILKYQLMDIKLAIKRTFIYSVIIAVISGVIFGVSFLNNWFTGHIPEFKTWMIPLISGIAAFIVGNLFWRKSKEVEKLKYEFITVAAHKLRTPLTDIKWAASAMRDEKISQRDKDKMLKGIIAADERLIDLTNELLGVAKMEANQYKYNFQPENFEKIVRKIVNEFQLQMKEKGVKLFYSAEKNLPEVKIDKIRIGSVIQTLMENAVLYTKSEVKVSIDVYKNNIIFHAEDNGIGVSKDDQENIFSKFYRTHEAYLTETEGAGLSLFLAKSIIEKHNGKIGVRSEGKGEGSVFWFSLPIA